MIPRRLYDTDRLAVILVQEAVANQVDRELTPPQKSFLYMPLMHSESALIHETAMELYRPARSGVQSGFREKNTKPSSIASVVYPHRNAILGRESTDEEVEFLKSPESIVLVKEVSSFKF